MTRNSANPGVHQSPRGKQMALDGGGTSTSLPPIARPILVITRGRIETVVRCPGCGDMHRHIGLGERHAPCGAVYRVQPRRGRAAA